MKFHDKLRQSRKEQGMSQEEFAEVLDVSRQAVSKWESGYGYPETTKLILIAKELDVSIDYLLNDNIKNSDFTQKVSNNNGSGIWIQSDDRKKAVVCYSVRTSKIVSPGKNEPHYVLLGISKGSIWGPKSTHLGWYEDLESVTREIDAITNALEKGDGTYKLQFNRDIEFVGIFGQPKMVTKKDRETGL